jgi:hypothetical protein
MHTTNPTNALAGGTEEAGKIAPMETGSARDSRQRRPDFFIVGHAKSGTTALYEMLRRHPQIYMPELKEPWFLADDMQARFQPRRTGRPPQTVEEYLDLFSAAAPDQRAGEASSCYLWSQSAARAIAEVQPDARIIALLREPTSFLRSFHLQLLQDHVEVEKDLRKAMDLEQARRRGKRVPRRSHRPQLLYYSNLIHYVDQLRRYKDLFPSNQVLVLIYEEFRRDNEETVRTVQRFLGVDATGPIELRKANPSALLRSQHLDDVVHSVSVGRGPLSGTAKAAVKAVVPRGYPRRLLQFVQGRVLKTEPPPLDEGFMLELRSRYKGEVETLSEYLGRDMVKLWGYDEVP